MPLSNVISSPGELSSGLSGLPAIDVVFAHRGPWESLWFSLQSCTMALQHCPVQYRFFVVDNGRRDAPLPSIAREVLDDFVDKGRLDLVSVPEPLSPPSARNMGAARGVAEFIFFFDNHCVPAPDYFSRALTQMTTKKLDMLHSSYRYGASDTRFHYSLSDFFWGTPEIRVPQSPNEPYRCAASGHGGFVVRRSIWEALGGYWSGFKGYGGEEEYWDMKLWLTGHEVWIDPKLIHAHLPGGRVYQRHFTADYFINLLACANLIGGEDLARSKFKHLRRVPQAQLFDMHRLFKEALQRSAEHAAQLQSTFVRTLDEQLEWFAQNEVPF